MNTFFHPIECPACHSVATNNFDSTPKCRQCGHLLTIREMAVDLEAFSKSMLKRPATKQDLGMAADALRYEIKCNEECSSCSNKIDSETCFTISMLENLVAKGDGDNDVPNGGRGNQSVPPRKGRPFGS